MKRILETPMTPQKALRTIARHKAPHALQSTLSLMGLALCLTALSMLSGCSLTGGMLAGEATAKPAFVEDNTPIIQLNNAAADELGDGIDDSELPEGSPIYFDRFQNRFNPADMAPLGQIVADQVAAQLAVNEFLVIDGPPVPAPLPVAEVDLPADPATATAPKQDAKAPAKKSLFFSEPETKRPAMLVGTYQLGKDVIWINARIRRISDGAIVSSHSWTLPINENTRQLLPSLRDESGTEPSVKSSF